MYCVDVYGCDGYKLKDVRRVFFGGEVCRRYWIRVVFVLLVLVGSLR